MAERKNFFNAYSNMEFPQYVFEEYPKALHLPNKDELIAKCLKDGQAALDALPPDVNKDIKAAISAEWQNKLLILKNETFVQVNSREEEQALLAQWASEGKISAPKITQPTSAAASKSVRTVDLAGQPLR